MGPDLRVQPRASGPRPRDVRGTSPSARIGWPSPSPRPPGCWASPVLWPTNWRLGASSRCCASAGAWSTPARPSRPWSRRRAWDSAPAEVGPVWRWPAIGVRGRDPVTPRRRFVPASHWSTSTSRRRPTPSAKAPTTLPAPTGPRPQARL